MDIVLIGMPGCGKSLIGKSVAKRLNMQFTDTDVQIEKREGKRITEIFEARGEEYFREKETECLRTSFGRSRVIATGGGVVKSDKNLEILKNSGAIVVFIDRPLENIMRNVRTDTRPLLKSGKGKLEALYKERYDRYMSACDIRIVNDTSKTDAVNKIIDEVKSYEDNGNKRS